MNEKKMINVITENATDAIIVIDDRGKIIYWNTTAAKIFGHTAEEAAGREVHRFIAPGKFHNAFQKGFDSFRTSGQGAVVGRTFELSAIRKDGTEFPIEISISAVRINSLWQATAMIRDITERRSMEESLFEEKRFAENLLENSAVATFVLDPQHKVVLWNKACEELTGVSSDEVIGTDNQWKPFYDHKRQTIADVVIDGNPEILPHLYDKHTGSTLISDGLHAEGWYQSLNRRKRYILFDAAPIYDSRGELTHVIETLQDITERKKAEEQLDTYRTQLEELVEERTAELRKANEMLEQDIVDRRRTEEALRKSEARFEEAQRVARLGTWEWNIETDEVYWSDEVYRIFGMNARQIVPGSQTFLDYIHPEDRDRVKEAVSSALSGNRPYSIEARVLRSDGALISIQSQGKVYLDKNGKPAAMLGNVQDITERKKLEEEIWKIHKLESIGVLAGGIAHDFNNLLSAILGNISLARLRARPGDGIFERLQEAEKAIQRTKNLSQQLLTFSKGGEPVKKVVSLSELVRESTDFALRGANIRAQYSIEEDLWPVEVDEGQISQVINNIVINAKQAMKEGGEIKIHGENVIVDARTVLPLAPGKYVKIAIRDEGIGIQEKHLERIFDPYFSTKQTGSGLGLAISFSIIKKHKGYLAVDSEPGAGAVFHIYLSASVDQMPEKDEKDKRLLSGRGKVLIMDDEDVILLIVGKMMDAIGYEAEFAGHGEMAIEKYVKALEGGRPFDAVIIDLTIRGGMGGRECIRELLKIDPAIRAIVSSGYSDDPIISKFREYGFKGIITKPYQVEDLSEILYSVIQGKENE
jgi:PAS domain S-box-containing protein